MKQSKAFYYSRIIIILFFIAACFFTTWLSGYYPSAATGKRFGFDSNFAYSFIIDKEIVTDWHCSLFMHEAIALKHAIFKLLGKALTGRETLCIMWWIGLCVTIANLSYYLNELFKKSAIFIFTIPFFYYAYLSFYSMSILTLEEFYLPVLLSCFSLVLVIKQSKSKLLHHISCFLLLILLAHLCSYRRNSILLIPLFIYFCPFPSFFSSLSRLPKCLFSIIISLVLYYSSNSLVCKFFPTTHYYAPAPMLATDMRIALLLQGQGDEEALSYLFKGEHPQSFEATTIYPILFCEDQFIQRDKHLTIQEEIRRDKLWHQFCLRYVKEWINNPIDMISARFILALKFYSGDSEPLLGKIWVKMLYPHIQQTHEMWNPFNISYRKKFTFYRLFGVFFSTCYLILFTSFSKVKQLIFAREMAIVSLVNIVYVLSFLIITPAAQLRYLLPTYFIGWMLLATFLPSAASEAFKSINLKHNQHPS